ATGTFPVRAGTLPGRSPRRALGLAPARPELSARRGARAADRERRCARLHGPEGDTPLLQHRRLPPRRVRDGEPTGAGDGDVRLARVAGRADRPELRLLGLARGAGRADAVRADLISRE